MTIFFPLNQTENASHRNHNTLLAVSVYERLHAFIKDALPVHALHPQATFNQSRVHRAVLIDGARGTGKSSVLINLDTYLQSKDLQLLQRVHIFKPVDPTLLEDHDDLFLNVIVAAMLSDEVVREAQARDADGRQQLQYQLQTLGQALESMQSQRDKQGLDKIRSFIGNQQLVEEVHNFFNAIRKLLGKDLLVLTIDDVDTSLNRAFENMEVVRRYLVTPYVLPLISGDLELYQEVTWREFHGRLLEDSSYKRKEAYERALGLAKEYQRKILPLQYRLKMPTVPDYLRNEHIRMGEEGNRHVFSLPMFHGWVEGLINGAVNGLENSRLPVPLPVVRALAQLVYQVKDLIPALAEYVCENKLTLRSLRRALVIPGVSNDKVEALQNAYRIGADNEAAYKAFIDTPAEPGPPSLSALAKTWHAVLRDHFQFDPVAGSVFLVMLARTYWDTLNTDQSSEWRSVFDTPLFQPLQHSSIYTQFDQNADLMDWRDHLQGRAPQRWINQLPSRAILPYPVPEAGKAVPNRIYTDSSNEHAGRFNLLIDLVLHRNFYSGNKRALLVCTGRIIELVITSLLRDIDEKDVATILERSPFYSFSSAAGTKAMQLSTEDGMDIFNEPVTRPPDANAIKELSTQIAQWRDEHRIAEINISPWLIYNVFNKVINQAWLFNRPLNVGQQPKSTQNYQISWVARQTFHSLWAAFGSFEKGPIYGFPDIVANVNIGLGVNFSNSDLYRQNIAPFYSEDGVVNTFGKTARAITSLLGSHPLRIWVEQLATPLPFALTKTDLDGFTSASGTPAPTNPAPTRKRPRAWLREHLRLSRLMTTPEARSLQQALKQTCKNRQDALRLLANFQDVYTDEKTISTLLSQAIDIAFPEQGD
ncbi:antiviral RADAR system adenosine triphosphatase RdrA [Janthinobacterium sp. NKUCC08_JDC]|uniref:antiviral RADAR system adenosine triphosphatase RdrA n=1 Tax=Janthinobacterium sp. NKUCC08_JDC TaxID=2842122 RepID=UPI001C5BCA0A|nr:antiviral RADAR system adenosine triphosphatase RdrA [Janthinobacterium sp. NKUCC08_JDC]MBW3497190.1 hypothetical protein [Janthinobacterium sp. NKUCC08_JDC]